MKRRTFLKFSAGAALTALLPREIFASQTTPQFLIPPTVQHLTETTAHIFFWIGDLLQPGSLLVEKDGTTVFDFPLEPSAPREWLFILDGLQPATTYTYRVVVEGNELPLLTMEQPWSGLTFTTPPHEWPLRICALGDTGFGDPTTRSIAQQVAQFDLDLFLHLGDIVYWMHQYNGDAWLNWGEKYYEPFYEVLRKVPHYPTFGNHETDGPARLNGQPSYFWMFPPINDDIQTHPTWTNDNRWWYAFDYNNIQFLSLNTQLFYMNTAMWNAQDEWLDQKLARTDVLYTVVFCHIPLYTSGGLHQWDGMYAAERWEQKFANSNVSLVLSGHAHVYERLLKNGVNYVTAGSASDTNYSMGERMASSVIFRSEPAYPIIELHPDRIHLTTYDANGGIIEDVDLALNS
jgi:predicted phosphodiesterase